jgi:hypothetical protein
MSVSTPNTEQIGTFTRSECRFTPAAVCRISHDQEVADGRWLTLTAAPVCLSREQSKMAYRCIHFLGDLPRGGLRALIVPCELLPLVLLLLLLLLLLPPPPPRAPHSTGQAPRTLVCQMPTVGPPIPSEF